MADTSHTPKLFDEISERVARQRFSLVVTFLAAKMATHWEALYVLAHPEKDAEAARATARALLDAQTPWDAWGKPILAALLVSIVYPWAAAVVRLSPEYANTWFHKKADMIGRTNISKALANARTDLETALAGVDVLKGELVRSLSIRLEDDTVDAFPFVPAEMFYSKAKDGSLVTVTSKNIHEGELYYAFLPLEAAGCVIASQQFVFLRTQPRKLYLLQTGAQVQELDHNSSHIVKASLVRKRDTTWELVVGTREPVTGPGS